MDAGGVELLELPHLAERHRALEADGDADLVRRRLDLDAARADVDALEDVDTDDEDVLHDDDVILATLLQDIFRDARTARRVEHGGETHCRRPAVS